MQLEHKKNLSKAENSSLSSIAFIHAAMFEGFPPKITEDFAHTCNNFRKIKLDFFIAMKLSL